MKRSYWLIACAIFSLNTGAMAEQVVSELVPEPTTNPATKLQPAEKTAPVESTPIIEKSAQPLPTTENADSDQTIIPIQATQPAHADTSSPKPVRAPEPIIAPTQAAAPPSAASETEPAAAQATVPQETLIEPPQQTQQQTSEPATTGPQTSDCGELAKSSQMELDKLQVYVAEVNKRLEKLRKELNQGEQKRRQQAVLIDFFEQELQTLRKRSPENNELVNTVFNELTAQLPESPVFRIENNRLIIMTDFTLIFGRGQVSTEGETRLQLIANALRQVGEKIPADVNWRWRVEGHSDTQPLRSITWFPSNWELSAARAAGIARYLIGQGIPAEKFRVAALGATHPVEPNAQTKDEHWRNRRVEIHFVLERN